MICPDLDKVKRRIPKRLRPSPVADGHKKDGLERRPAFFGVGCPAEAWLLVERGSPGCVPDWHWAGRDPPDCQVIATQLLGENAFAPNTLKVLRRANNSMRPRFDAAREGGG
jgi:hypothetical protein